MNHPDAFRAEVLQHLDHRLDPLLRERAYHLALDAGRVRQRAKQVENSAGTELNPRRTDILHRRMMGRSEHKSNPGIPNASANMRSIEVYLDAKRLQNVGRAGLRGQCTVAVL